MRITDKFVLFFRATKLGNWVRVPGGIIVNLLGKSYTFPTSEHVFMALKAVYFNDLDTLEQICQTSNPREAKKLGRQVKGFSELEWEQVRENCMWQAIKLRAAFDLGFRNELLLDCYSGKEFVECNPVDRIWGIGLEEEDPLANDKSTWQGLNLLGKLLTKLRNELKLEKEQNG